MSLRILFLFGTVIRLHFFCTTFFRDAQEQKHAYYKLKTRETLGSTSSTEFTSFHCRLEKVALNSLSRRWSSLSWRSRARSEAVRFLDSMTSSLSTSSNFTELFTLTGGGTFEDWEDGEGFEDDVGRESGTPVGVRDTLAGLVVFEFGRVLWEWDWLSCENSKFWKCVFSSFSCCSVVVVLWVVASEGSVVRFKGVSVVISCTYKRHNEGKESRYQSVVIPWERGLFLICRTGTNKLSRYGTDVWSPLSFKFGNSLQAEAVARCPEEAAVAM